MAAVHVLNCCCHSVLSATSAAIGGQDIHQRVRLAPLRLVPDPLISLSALWPRDSHPVSPCGCSRTVRIATALVLYSGLIPESVSVSSILASANLRGFCFASPLWAFALIVKCSLLLVLYIATCMPKSSALFATSNPASAQRQLISANKWRLFALYSPSTRPVSR
jgi:hypothetical protein